MSNVVSMGQSCDFLVARAAKHRRAGRYDEAMTLLSKAKDQFGSKEEIEYEAACVYEAIGCYDDARRAYLRVFSFHDEHEAEALYRLVLLSASQGDLDRAASYCQRLLSLKQKKISGEDIDALCSQLAKAGKKTVSRGRNARVRALDRRAVSCLHAGKPTAAERNMRHVLFLQPSAQRFTLLACCMMLREKYSEAIEYAQMAHELSPARVQTICVLADACISAGRHAEARRWIYLAAMRAMNTEDILAVATESAKHGEDTLTHRLTQTALKREPFHIRAMMLQACALTNLGRFKEASRLFGRLSGLLPDDIVSDTYYRMTKEEKRPQERLSHGIDLTHQDGVELVKGLLSLLYEDPDSIKADKAAMDRICRQCAWAIRSPMAGSHAKTVVLILMSALDTDECRRVLLDSLLDPFAPDSFKAGVLQVMTKKHGFMPYDVDFGGKLVRLAAGGMSSKPVRSTEMNQKIVQHAVDMLAPEYPDAPGILLPVYLSYADRFGAPKKRHEQVCAAALEYVYHVKKDTGIPLDRVARRYCIPKRLCALIVRRMLKAEASHTEY